MTYRVFRHTSLLLSLVWLLGPPLRTVGAQESYDARSELRPRVIRRSEGQKRFLPNGIVMLLKVGPVNTGSSYLFMAYDDLPPGAAIPRHRHEIDEEILIVHRGTLLITLNTDTAIARAGDAVFLSPGTWISARNPGRDTTSLFAIFPRGTVEQCFQLLGQADLARRHAETPEELRQEHRLCRMSY